MGNSESDFETSNTIPAIHEPAIEHNILRQVCICEPILLRVFYLNPTSINPNNTQTREKLRELSEKIRNYRPHIVAIVESWLKDSIENQGIQETLYLQGYRIYRQDRSQRTGGGVFVAFNFGEIPIQEVHLTESDLSPMDINEAIMPFELKYDYRRNITPCVKCNSGNFEKYGLIVAYRRPGKFRDQTRSDFLEKNSEFENKLLHIKNFLQNSSPVGDEFNPVVTVGDFNFNCSIQSQYVYIREGDDQYVDLPTHYRGGYLDLVFSNQRGFVHNNHVDVVEMLHPKFHHSALKFELNLGMVKHGCIACQFD